MDAARSDAASPHARRRRPPCPPRPRPRPRRCRRLVGEACRIASIERSFERRFDPHRRALHAHCVRWIGEQSLAPAGSPPADLRALRYPDLVAGYYVGAPPAVLEAIAGLSVWFFVWDDRHDEDARRLRRAAWARLRDALCAVLASPRARVADAEPIVGALSDCIVRIRARLGDAWNRRFTGHLRQMIDAYDDEFRARLAARIPTRDAYMRLRERTFGCEVWLDCLELAAGRALPDAVRAAPPYRLAGRASQQFAALYNDLCSLRKEREAEEIHHLGISLMHHERISLRAAMREMHALASAQVERFPAGQAEPLRFVAASGAPPEIAAAARHCAANMGNWISSVYWFHHESDRYGTARDF